jgi:hypothetical protein
MKKIRAQETEEARTNRRDSNKARMQENRAQETPEASATRRISTRIRNRKARAQETAETRTNRRISNREKMQENRAQETLEASATRRISNREKLQENRAQETPEASRAFFKNSSVGGGGIYKKVPYYTKCGEMIDGCWKQKVWCGIAFNSRRIWGYSPPEKFCIFLPL